MKKRIAYETLDGKLHADLESAKSHAKFHYDAAFGDFIQRHRRDYNSFNIDNSFNTDTFAPQFIEENLDELAILKALRDDMDIDIVD